MHTSESMDYVCLISGMNQRNLLGRDDNNMKLREIFALILGGIGILVLDLAFNGASESDLFFPLWLRQSIPPQLNATTTSGSSIPIIGSLLPPGQNIFIYLLGGALLGIAMIILILSNRNRTQVSQKTQ